MLGGSNSFCRGLEPSGQQRCPLSYLVEVKAIQVERGSRVKREVGIGVNLPYTNIKHYIASMNIEPLSFSSTMSSLMAEV